MRNNVVQNLDLKKNMVFGQSGSHCSETLNFEGSGSIWEVPRTDQTRNIRQHNRKRRVGQACACAGNRRSQKSFFPTFKPDSRPRDVNKH